MVNGALFTLALLSAPPVSKDPQLEVIEFAREPDIVTPTGIAVDKEGAILVIECHTHFPLENYPGPKHDRILRFIDKDGDGKPESRNIFFEGTQKTMSIGIHPSGWVWIATRSEIFRIKDTDNDGVADKRETMVRLETTADYPHNGLCGFAIEPVEHGNVYFGLGENFGEPFKLVGTDGSTQTGGGEGGSLFHCRHDGTKVTRFATGFWNPYHLCFDDLFRLFVVDNDPDERPPCRLLHIVKEGDYGYRFRNGRKGTHPFTAWNGELPGTLPMVAGTGEAPSGMVHLNTIGWPADYTRTLMVTSWGDHRLERYHLVPNGASFTSQPEPIVVGGEDFRPVGIALTKQRGLIVTDWVDKSYNVHRKGRLWLVRPKKIQDSVSDDKSLSMKEAYWHLSLPRLMDSGGSQAANNVSIVPKEIRTDDARPSFASFIREMPRFVTTTKLCEIARANPNPEIRAEALRRISGRDADVNVLIDSWKSTDPFIRQASLVGMKNSLSIDQKKQLCESTDAHERLAGAVLMREADEKVLAEVTPRLLADADAGVRAAAIQTIAERGLRSFRPEVVELMESGNATGQLMLACLAALDDLDRKKKSASDEIKPEDLLVSMLSKPNPDPKFVAAALPLVRGNHPKLSTGLLDRLAKTPDAAARREVLATLRSRPEGESAPRLLSWLTDWKKHPKQDMDLAAEAVAGLSAINPNARTMLIEIAKNKDYPSQVRTEALRSLRGATLAAEELSALESAYPADSAGVELIQRLKGIKLKSPEVADTSAWNKLLDTQLPGDWAAGRRVFFHPQGPGCFKCHKYNGRGGEAGPDLSTIGKTMTRDRLVESIIQPSKEIAPMYTPWTLVFSDGRTKSALHIGGTNNNTQIYVDPTGTRFEMKPEDIETRKPSTVSIMPAELATEMTHQEFKDLIAFLMHQ